MESLNIFIRSIFIDNMVFAFFFGMCSYIAVSKSVKTALGLGLAVTFVMVMTVPFLTIVPGSTLCILAEPPSVAPAPLTLI